MNENSRMQVGKRAVVVKAGIWYTICNFLFRGMAFITTPIFTRLLTKNELGAFSNYSSWITILTVLTSFDLAQSVIRSKVEHEKDIDCYIWSILSFSTLWTIFVYIFVCMFPQGFISLFQVDMQYIHMMFIYLLVSPAYTMLITKHRAFYKYKTFIILTGIMTLSGTFLSLILVLFMQDKLAGRIIGNYLPYIIISAIIYVFLVVRGKEIKTKYWKYACTICLPLVPHTLSLYLLSSSDKIIITNICGTEYTALYSVAYSAYHIATILFDSMNKAWAPWLLDNLHMRRYEEIKAMSKKYINIFVTLIIGIFLMSPEIIMILGGEKYTNAIYCLPPLITSCTFQFIYTMYVNIEFYKKKTLGVSVATLIATTINICLNIVFIPMNVKYCYVIAAYTTLIGYIILFVLHYFIVKRMKMDHVYNTRYVIIILMFVFSFSLIMNLVYNVSIIRFTLIITYIFSILGWGVKYKTYIVKILRNKTDI